jgi:hypothetical protein
MFGLEDASSEESYYRQDLVTVSQFEQYHRLDYIDIPLRGFDVRGN